MEERENNFIVNRIMDSSRETRDEQISPASASSVGSFGRSAPCSPMSSASSSASLNEQTQMPATTTLESSGLGTSLDTTSASSPPTRITFNPEYSSSPRARKTAALKFSIDEILRADFANNCRKNSQLMLFQKVNVTTSTMSSSASSSSTGSAFSSPHSVSSSLLFEESNNNNNATAAAVVHPMDTSSAVFQAATAQLAAAATGNTKFPAWIFCTRYSDRPSSGPRNKKIKKRKEVTVNAQISPADVASSIVSSRIGVATATTTTTTTTNLSSASLNTLSSTSNAQLLEEEKRPRTAFTNEQLERLKQQFVDSKYLTEKRRQELAHELGLNESQIKIWFQNKRAKLKKSVVVQRPAVLALQLMAAQGLLHP